MTRRGTLIYYLTAWVIGCFSIAVAIWIKGLLADELPLQNRSFDLLGFAFYAMVFGGALSLLGGFVLRKLMDALKCRTPLHWAAAGAILAPALVLAAARMGRGLAVVTLNKWPAFRSSVAVVEFVFFVGANTVVANGWWLAIPAGAATAYLLGRVERAFAPLQTNA